jgi:Skp family chaperone for outer membrane proteins
MKIRLLLAIIGALLTASTVFGQTPVPKTNPPAGATTPAEMPKTKVALLSFFALREGIEELKQRYQKLQSEFAPRATELDSLQSTIEGKEKILSENKSLTAVQGRKLQDEIEGYKKEYQRKLEDSQEMARKREAEETGPVLEKISTFLEKYCQRYGITHVFDINRLLEANAALYAAPQTNITEDFVKEYNKAHPSGTAAPAAPAAKKP